MRATIKKGTDGWWYAMVYDEDGVIVGCVAHYKKRRAKKLTKHLSGYNGTFNKIT